jgi:hypothetical protein
MRLFRRNANSQLRQSRATIRHQPFTARLVNWWPRAVGDYYVQPTLPRSDCRRQSSRPAPNDENVCLFVH